MEITAEFLSELEDLRNRGCKIAFYFKILIVWYAVSILNEIEPLDVHTGVKGFWKPDDYGLYLGRRGSKIQYFTGRPAWIFQLR